MTRWLLPISILLLGCHERAAHEMYGVTVHDACAATEYTIGNHCMSGEVVTFTSLVVSATLTIWAVLTLRRIAATTDTVEALVRVIEEQTRAKKPNRDE